MRVWERMAYDPVPWAYRALFVVCLIVLLVFGLSGCSQFGDSRTQPENMKLDTTYRCGIQAVGVRDGVMYAYQKCWAEE